MVRAVLACRVLGLILRGVCLMRRHEIDWVFRGGCRVLFPAAWDAFVHSLSARERKDPLQAYYARLTSEDAKVRQSASRRMFALQASLRIAGGSSVQVWDGQKWDVKDLESLESHADLPRAAGGELPRTRAEHFLACTSPANPEFPGCPPGDGTVSAQQILTCHYSVHNGFAVGEEILENINALRGIPAIAVQGRNDMVCPVTSAYDLHRAWPELELQVVTEGGHSMYDPRISQALTIATRRMEALVRQKAKRRRLRRAEQVAKRERERRR